MTKAIVIGAGIVGSSVACRLAQAEIDVVVVDRAEAGTGTTGASFAWTNANQKIPRDYFELNLAGLNEHYRLRDEFEGAPWFHPVGNLVWTGEDARYDELRRRVDRLDSWGYEVRWLPAYQVNTELEPHLAFSAPTMPIAYFPKEGWVEAPVLARYLLERVRIAGGTVYLDDHVQSIELQSDRVSVTTESQPSIEADYVINAAGPSADRVAAMVGRNLPLSPTRGLLVQLKTDTPVLSRLIHSTQVNARPDGESRILIHHDSIDALIGDRDQIDIDDDLIRELFSRIQRILPSTNEATIEHALIGTRPFPADGRSSFGAVKSLPGYVEAVTHSGVTLGPLIGRLLTDELVRGNIDALATPFRADRFREI